METRIYERGGDLLALEETAHMPYRWAMGLDSSKFFQEIAAREVLLGIRCHKCGKVYVPPRRLCGPCFVKIDELVELGSEGVIEAVTLVNYGFIDPDTGRQRPIPYYYGYIKLDGADNLFSHIIQTPPGQEVKVGDRVRAVFAEKKRGHILDISHFEPAPA
ncbi:MAG: Zn-ribbon domain-containing OB-fold protein [Proteobacteria bacterium]|nr:Zn-ribbon domain-containing OB-fold protein [Pseudomonadota bacterium]